ncbi:MAG: hypothetical protein HN396_04635 [Gemmatimonadales bacterium]|jgi:hypothetical protein|nr:hypothetical protein [Gemmatimonadales bacterium]
MTDEARDKHEDGWAAALQEEARGEPVGDALRLLRGLLVLVDDETSLSLGGQYILSDDAVRRVRRYLGRDETADMGRLLEQIRGDRDPGGRRGMRKAQADD